jgi:tetratricopeptide (TPR) repeat protein
VAEASLDGLRARRALLDARLDEPDAGAKLDALKADIGVLFKTVDAEYKQLGVLREEVLALVEKWKGVRANSGGVAPHLDGAKPAVQNAVHNAVHSDHLGASTFIEKGWHRISAGEYAEADTFLKKALELSPGDAQAESLLGWSLMLQDRYDDALVSFQRVLVREPMNALARVNLGYICLKKRIFGEAIEHLSRAIRLDNDKKATLYAHFYLGLVYLEREMFEDAQTFFQKTVALGPNLIEAYFELGRAYWFNSQRHEATSTWQAGFSANKFNPWGKRCAEAIETVAAGGVP